MRASSAPETAKAEPLRTCLGCRRKAAQRELVRLLVDEGQVVVDPRRSGRRGAWLHPERECFEEAAKRKAFGRAFRAPSVQAAPGMLRDLLTRNTRKD